ncbi:MAG: gyrase subunit A protein [Candidatus Peregrinibacteria bacterium GW2011_GWA2_33_10]|nr:MAG: gyrase subunit A protein [Candidatus Peregrinibacteria bacterium GW2011_GWA2_33_10]
MQKDEKVTAMFKIQEDSYKKYLVMATIGGTVKKTEIEAFKNIRQNGLLAIKLKDGDYLNWVKESGDKDEVILVTKNGKCIRFPENNIRSMGRISMGVRGIKLKNDDQVVEMEVSENPEESKLVVVTENGLGKSTELVNYRNQRRGGSGIKTANVTAKTGPIMKAEIIHKDQEGDIIIISRQGQTIRLNLKDIPDRGRSTQGVYLMRMKNNDKIASISIINKEDEGEETPPEVNEKQQDLFALSKK